MPYKENCNVEGHILTRFKIARLYFHDKIPQKEIAARIGCHRNTVGNVIKMCKKEASREAWRYLKSAEGLTESRLIELFRFLKPEKPKPHSHPKQLRGEDEEYIVKRHEKLGYGPQRLYTTLKREGVDMSRYTLAKIKGVYKRNALETKKVRTSNGNRRALYDYTKIGAFEQLQYDTKELLDKKALPKTLYDFFEQQDYMPKYQWTIIDAKTRTRFLAWSHTLSSWYGATFLFIVICWLRAHGIWHHIHTQFDGGAEFCSASNVKLALWNTLFTPFNASVSHTEGVKWLQNLVERSHKPDDQEFYVPRGQFMTSKTDFLIEAQRWLLYWNTERHHSGIGMNNATPQERLQQLGLHQANTLTHFPVLILDDLFHPLQKISNILNPQNAQKVLTYYQLIPGVTHAMGRHLQRCRQRLRRRHRRGRRRYGKAVRH